MKKNDSLYLNSLENRARALPTGLLCNIIDEFLASKSNDLLDKKVEINKFEWYCYNATTLLRLGPPIF